ncbi:MAG: hypothetical protein PHC64_00805 [Candidatus Gastranaerophilales bacterium]|nr:hypothetical protein [Candidatus Gastranaerophilales bacterium]
MSKKLNNKTIKKMLLLGVDLSIMESLSRILTDTIQDYKESQYFDSENLSVVLKNKIISTKNRYHSIVKYLNI